MTQSHFPGTVSESSRCRKTKKKNRDGHGVVKINDKPEKWWDKQNITVLKEQAVIRGREYTDLEAKGYKIIDPDDTNKKKKIWKEKPYRRDDYLRI